MSSWCSRNITHKKRFQVATIPIRTVNVLTFLFSFLCSLFVSHEKNVNHKHFSGWVNFPYPSFHPSISFIMSGGGEDPFYPSREIGLSSIFAINKEA